MTLEELAAELAPASKEATPKKEEPPKEEKKPTELKIYNPNIHRHFNLVVNDGNGKIERHWMDGAGSIIEIEDWGIYN